jgi:hypothetical protein
VEKNLRDRKSSQEVTFSVWRSTTAFKSCCHPSNDCPPDTSKAKTISSKTLMMYVFITTEVAWQPIKA